MTAKFFVDSNILVYAIGAAGKDAFKVPIARGLLDEPQLGLSVQVLSEFYVVVTSPRCQKPLSHEETMAFINVWKQFTIQTITLPLFEKGVELKVRFQISLWDALIIAAAKFLGCPIVYSEDLNAGQEYEGVKVINPFI